MKEQIQIILTIDIVFEPTETGYSAMLRRYPDALPLVPHLKKRGG